MTDYSLGDYQKTEIEEKIQEVEKSIKNDEFFNPVSLEELMKKEFPKIYWVVEQLIPVESVVAISGVPSAYKTWVILDIALKVSQGGILFDKFTTDKTGVLIVDEETGERWVQQRIVKLQSTFSLPLYLLSKRGFKLTEETVNLLITFSKDHKIGLIIFDSFLRIHTASNENDAVEMAKVFSLFQKLTKAGITVIFTHHNRKPGILRSTNLSQDMRGSSDILAAVDCHLAIERKEDSIVISQTKLRQGEEVKPFKLNIIQEEHALRFEFSGEIDEEQTKKTDFQEAIKDLLTQENKFMYKKELFDTLKKIGVEGGYSTFKSAVAQMAEKGELFERQGEKNKVFCSLVPFDQEQITVLSSG
ncbi:AAA family ATPase [Candidatus Gottesmanbacteria bacterium]|nr:AAA family ATPase [Candidatus Gottesmanbacteria bacterium]